MLTIGSQMSYLISHHLLPDLTCCINNLSPSLTNSNMHCAADNASNYHKFLAAMIQKGN